MEKHKAIPHGYMTVGEVAKKDVYKRQLLPAVAAGLIRRMDDDLLYKLIDDGGRQFPDTHILPHNSCKAGKIGLILFKDYYCFSPYLDLLR